MTAPPMATRLVPRSHRHPAILPGKRDAYSNMTSLEDVEARFGPAVSIGRMVVYVVSEIEPPNF